MVGEHVLDQIQTIASERLIGLTGFLPAVENHQYDWFQPAKKNGLVSRRLAA